MAAQLIDINTSKRQLFFTLSIWWRRRLSCAIVRRLEVVKVWRYSEWILSWNMYCTCTWCVSAHAHVMLVQLFVSLWQFICKYKSKYISVVYVHTLFNSFLMLQDSSLFWAKVLGQRPTFILFTLAVSQICLMVVILAFQNWQLVSEIPQKYMI